LPSLRRANIVSGVRFCRFSTKDVMINYVLSEN
jgi:hypothetical protein